MARRTVTECDRCGKEITGGGSTIYLENRHSRVLCTLCAAAFKRFMKNEDQVGEYVYRSETLPCNHHVPCAGPCGETVYKLARR